MIYRERQRRLIVMSKNSYKSVKQKDRKDMDKVHRKKFKLKKHEYLLNVKQMHKTHKEMQINNIRERHFLHNIIALA